MDGGAQFAGFLGPRKKSCAPPPPPPPPPPQLGTASFRLFTKESLSRIRRRIADEQERLEHEAQCKREQDGGTGGGGAGGTAGTEDDGKGKKNEDDEPQPNPALEVGSKLSSKLGYFPPELYGKPIEDLDDYYRNKLTFMVVARDKTIFRFDAADAVFLFSPFNPIRRAALYILTHPCFSLFVMVVILVNCVFMATNQEIPNTEETFTSIYTVESTLKIIARGFILSNFSYLRDAWNWLDFIVVSLAYITMAFPMGNLAALRTFRVLRALKTVAVVPGLKTIVGALMEAVRRLRDVMILSVFVLSIFALVGLQLYAGSLKQRCILTPDEDWKKQAPETELHAFLSNSSNWYNAAKGGKLCGDNSQCPENYTCQMGGPNPNFGYTSFDNFLWALLCAFRLMTQDYWESLYQLVIRANGPIHVLFFIIVIFLGSFYLVNLILAIVAMSYDDCQKQDKEKEEAEEEELLAEEERLQAFEDGGAMGGTDGCLGVKSSPSDSSDASVDWYPVPMRRATQFSTDSRRDCTSTKSDCQLDLLHQRQFSLVARRNRQPTSASLPASPVTAVSQHNTNARFRSTRFNWRNRRKYSLPGAGGGPSLYQRPIFPVGGLYPCLDNLSLPYADDDDDDSNDAICTKRSRVTVSLPAPVCAEKTSAGDGGEVDDDDVEDVNDSATLRSFLEATAAAAAARRRGSRLPSYVIGASITSQLGLDFDASGVGLTAAAQRRRASTATRNSIASTRLSNLRTSNPTLPPPATAFTLYGQRVSPSRNDPTAAKQDRNCEPTHFHWTTTATVSKRRPTLVPAAVAGAGVGSVVPARSGEAGRLKIIAGGDGGNGVLKKSNNRSQDFAVDKTELDGGKAKLFSDNPFVCLTPCSSIVEINGFMDVEAEESKKAYLKAKCSLLLFGWECSPGWYRFAHFVELFIMDAFVDLFITLCIVLNTVFMAMDHAGMSDQMAKALTIGNYVFTAIFTLEAILKICALGLYKYLQDKWSCFDIVIVLLSLVELGLANVKGLSILRSFRLLRVFKLAKSWPTLNLLIGIIGRTMGALGNLCFVLAIIVFIFAVMGMQLFGSNYTVAKFNGIPRWHFGDFLHSFMIVFRVLCGEWIESMWDCIYCSGFICVPFFLLTMVIGNLVVLNLFLALLLSSFGAESLKHSQEDSEPNKLQEAVDRINRCIIYVKSKIVYCIRSRVSLQAAAESAARESSGGGKGGEKRPERNHKVDLLIGSKVKIKLHGGVDPHARQAAVIPNGHSRSLMLGNSQPKSRQLIPQHMPANDFQSPVTVVSADPSRRTSDNGSQLVVVSPVTTLRALTDDSAVNEPAAYSSVSTTMLSRISSKNSYNNGVDHGVGSSTISTTRSLTSPTDSSCGDPSASSSSRSMSHPCHVNIRRRSLSNYSVSADDLTVSGDSERPLEGPEINEVNVVFVKYPDDCCPANCAGGRCRGCCEGFARTAIGRCWWCCRCGMYKVVEHKYFETFVIIMIVASSLALAIEDIDLDNRPILKVILKYTDRAFTIIFVVEMIVKQTAYGFKKYFTDAWCWLDFIIVGISLISLGAEGAGMGNIGAFRALRTLRALRPLRAVSRWEGMKVVVNALIQAIPAIFNVLLVCLVFWLIFSIMGVNLFGGRFRSCVYEDGKTVEITIVANETQCLERASDLNLTWENPKIHFDNVLIAYLALFQVATFKGWIPIMNDAIDSKEPNQQHEYEGRVFMYLYFVFFIVFGSFFTLNLFIGVIIDNFNMQKKKCVSCYSRGITGDVYDRGSKKYYNAMKKLGSKQPQKPIPRPKLRCQQFFFILTTDQKFDIVIMVVILLNMMTMAMEHHDQPITLTNVLGFINQVFIAIFTLECVMKLLGLRWYYFKQPWNVFDFCVVVMSILGQAMSGLIENLVVSPTLLRVVRVFRVGRVLRLVKSAKGIRTLLFSLAVSLPALFNIGLLLFLIMFIYAIFGMSFFMHVRHTAGLDDMFNFETFHRSMILLFQVSTSAGWDSVLAGLMNDDCNSTSTEDRPSGDCGNSGLAVMYLVTYLVISFLVVINMYIAVILENFSQATEDVQQGLTQDDFDMYYEVWERFDEKATQYIPLERLCEFVDSLEPPLRIPLPNFYRLVALDVPICENDTVHCVDVLDLLTKNFLGASSADGTPGGELGDLKKGPERKDYHPVSSMIKRQREIYAATVIQRTWIMYMERQRSTLRHVVPTVTTMDYDEETKIEEENGDKGSREQVDKYGGLIRTMRPFGMGESPPGTRKIQSVVVIDLDADCHDNNTRVVTDCSADFDKTCEEEEI